MELQSSNSGFIGRAFKKRNRPRERHCQSIPLMNQQGKLQIQNVNIPRLHSLYIADHFTTIIEWQWHNVILVFILTFVTSWMVFGSLWWGIYSYRLKHFNNTCIEKINGWTSAFLFSLESQTTIGYGGRQITPDCPEGTILLLIQCIVGLLILSTMVGLVFTKLQQPHLRSATILFSNIAVVAPRNGRLCLMFRIGNIRKSQLLRPHVKVFLVHKRLTSSKITGSRRNLRVTNDTKNTTEIDDLYLFVPLIVCHVIDKQSPLYECSQEEFHKQQLEVNVILEGIIEPTGHTLQARTTYQPEQIKWNHVFSTIAKEDGVGENCNYLIDFSKFHSTKPVISRQDELRHNNNP